MHIEQDSRISSDSVHRIMDIILLPFIWAVSLWKIEHSLPTLLETENTNAVEVTCSMFITRLLYWRFFFLMAL